MTTRAKIWILRPYLDSAHWIEEESTILTCNTCQMAYVGQTSHNLRQSYQEHIWYNNPQSAYAQHILNNRHNYGPIDNTVYLLNKSTTIRCYCIGWLISKVSYRLVLLVVGGKKLLCVRSVVDSVVRVYLCLVPVQCSKPLSSRVC